MELKGFPGSRELQRIKSMVDSTYGDILMQQKVYDRICADLDRVANTGNQDTKNAAGELKTYVAQFVQEAATKPSSRPATTESRGAVSRLYAARSKGEEGVCNPRNVRPARQQGYDPSVTVENCIYYLQGDIPQNWNGKYKVIGTTSRPTAFIAQVIAEKAPGTHAVPKETKQPQYIDDMVKATSSLRSYVTELERSINNLQETTVADENLATVITSGEKAWKTEKDKLGKVSLLVSGLDARYEHLPSQIDFVTVYKRSSNLESVLQNMLGELKQRLADYDKQQKWAGYKTKLPETEMPTENMYGVEVVIGRRTVKIVFPESGLPNTVKDFQNYLRDEGNFPDRQDREALSEFNRQVDAGSSVVYTPGIIKPSAPFSKTFVKGKTSVSLDPNTKEPKKRQAHKTQVRTTEGGGVG